MVRHHGVGVGQQQVGQPFGGFRGADHDDGGLGVGGEAAGLQLLELAAGGVGPVAGEQFIELFRRILPLQFHGGKGPGDVKEGGDDVDQQVCKEQQQHHAEEGEHHEHRPLHPHQPRGGDLQLEGFQVVPTGPAQLMVDPAGGEEGGAVRQHVAAAGAGGEGGLEHRPGGQVHGDIPGDDGLPRLVHDHMPVPGEGAQQLVLVPGGVDVQQHGTEAGGIVLVKEEGVEGGAAVLALEGHQVGVVLRVEEDLHHLLVVEVAGPGGAVAALGGKDGVQVLVVDHDVVDEVAAAGEVPQVPVADGPLRPGEVIAGAQGADGGGVEHLHGGGVDIGVGAVHHRIHIVPEAVAGGGDALEGGGPELEEEDGEDGKEGQQQQHDPAHLDEPPLDADGAVVHKKAPLPPLLPVRQHYYRG